VTAPDAAADKRLAERLVFAAADFPTGWSITPPSPEDESDVELNNELARCAGAPDPAAVESATAESPDFAMGEMFTASSTATIVKTVADAQADLRAVQGARFPDCLRTAFTDVLQKNLGSSAMGAPRVTVDPLTVARIGDASLAYRSTFAFQVSPGVTAQFFIDIFLLLEQRAEVGVFFFGLGQPFDPSLEGDLVQKLGDRLEAI
jgi:hypothetical protein